MASIEADGAKTVTCKLPKAMLPVVVGDDGKIVADIARYVSTQPVDQCFAPGFAQIQLRYGGSGFGFFVGWIQIWILWCVDPDLGSLT
jgi:hypothetical protein